MTPLRETIETDLAATIEGEFASKDSDGTGLVTLVDPNGVTYAGLLARVQYDYVRIQPGGETVVIHEPMVILRRSSLARIPAAGETWHLRMPVSPEADADPVDFLLDPSRAPEAGESIGFIKLFPKKAAQA